MQQILLLRKDHWYSKKQEFTFADVAEKVWNRSKVFSCLYMLLSSYEDAFATELALWLSLHCNRHAKEWLNIS